MNPSRFPLRLRAFAFSGASARCKTPPTPVDSHPAASTEGALIEQQQNELQRSPTDSGSANQRANRGGIAARSIVYALLLSIAAALIIFTNLGGPRMEGDEAQYALCTDQIKRSGEWLTLRPQPPRPYFEKPPLYMWFTAATYNHLPGLELKYRFWSAVFAIACVGLTCLLGARLLSPEIGLLGGALLLTNPAFLLEHGARQGVMDTGVTLALLVMLSCYARAVRQQSGWIAWIGTGIAAGLACLLKPFIGVPMLLILALHAAFSSRAGTRRPCIIGLSIASLSAAIVGLPWYIVQLARFGVSSFQSTLGATFVKRLTTGLDDRHLQGPLFYVREISASSPAFALSVPTIFFAIVLLCKRPAPQHSMAPAGGLQSQQSRDGMSLLLTVAAGWIALFSLSRSKLLHYSLPAFPAIAILIAALFAAAVEWAAAQAGKFHRIRHRSDPRVKQLIVGTWLVALGACVVTSCWLGMVVMPRQTKKYLPAEIYRTLRPAIDANHARLVFAGLPAAPGAPRDPEALDSSDLFYLSHMPGAIVADRPEEFVRLLQDKQPTLAFIAKDFDLDELSRQLGLRSRGDDRFAADHRAYVVAALDLAPLLRSRLSDGTGLPYIRLTPAGAVAPTTSASVRPTTHPLETAFEGSFALRVTPPLPDSCRLVVTIRPAAEMVGRSIRWIGRDRDEMPPPRPAIRLNPLQPFAVALERDSKHPTAEREVRFTLSLADGPQAGQPVRGTIVDAELIVLPKVPVENENKLR
jgi:4-amino-4-deoxy-L-arabinose transferase-like glycosyltransferase